MNDKSVRLHSDVIFMTRVMGENRTSIDFREFMKSIVSIKNFHSLSKEEELSFIEKISDMYMENTNSAIPEELKSRFYAETQAKKRLGLINNLGFYVIL